MLRSALVPLAAAAASRRSLLSSMAPILALLALSWRSGCWQRSKQHSVWWSCWRAVRHSRSWSDSAARSWMTCRWVLELSALKIAISGQQHPAGHKKPPVWPPSRPYGAGMSGWHSRHCESEARTWPSWQGWRNKHAGPRSTAALLSPPLHAPALVVTPNKALRTAALECPSPLAASISGPSPHSCCSLLHRRPPRSPCYNWQTSTSKRCRCRATAISNA